MARPPLPPGQEVSAIEELNTSLGLVARRDFFLIFLARGQKYLRSTGLAYHFVGNAKIAFIRQMHVGLSTTELESFVIC